KSEPLVMGKCTARSSTRRMSSVPAADVGWGAGSVSNIGKAGLVMVFGNGHEGRFVDMALRRDIPAPWRESAARGQGGQVGRLPFDGDQAMGRVRIQARDGRHQAECVGM